MNTLFYRAWLPISLAVHVILLFVLNVVPLGVPRVGGEKSFIPVGIVEAAQPPATVKPLKPEVNPLPEMKPETTSDRANPNTANQPKLPKTVPPGKQSIDPSITTGNASRQGNDTITLEKGPGIGAKAPPSIMAAKNGTGFDAPPGTDGSMGTGGSTEAGVSGPSYGPKSKYGRVDTGVDKLAGEINLNTSAVFSVLVSETGSISNVTLTKPTGNADLDRIASRLVRRRAYDPAMKNGKVVAETIQVKVEFNSGRYTVEDL